MRDMVFNDTYGRDHQRNYNLDHPAKGVMIHTLTAAYPWWKTIYENGGAPASSGRTISAMPLPPKRKSAKLAISRRNSAL